MDAPTDPNTGRTAIRMAPTDPITERTATAIRMAPTYPNMERTATTIRMAPTYPKLHINDVCEKANRYISEILPPTKCCQKLLIDCFCSHPQGTIQFWAKELSIQIAEGGGAGLLYQKLIEGCIHEYCKSLDEKDIEWLLDLCEAAHSDTEDNLAYIFRDDLQEDVISTIKEVCQSYVEKFSHGKSNYVMINDMYHKYSCIISWQGKMIPLLCFGLKELTNRISSKIADDYIESIKTTGVISFISTNMASFAELLKGLGSEMVEILRATNSDLVIFLLKAFEYYHNLNMEPERLSDDEISDSHLENQRSNSLGENPYSILQPNHLHIGRIMLNTSTRACLDDNSDDTSDDNSDGTIINSQISKRRFNDGIINDNYKLPNIKLFAHDCKPKDNLRAYIEDIELHFSGTITKVYEFDPTENTKTSRLLFELYTKSGLYEVSEYSINGEKRYGLMPK